MAESAPEHLTEIGRWLWLRMPRPVREPVLRGQGFVGLKSVSGIYWAGVMSDYYHTYWGAPIFKPTGWRRSLWLCHRPLFRWIRPTKLQFKYGIAHG